ncbi:uncharacterized protein BX664DRAFT_322446 [Halteromyces radiatus]|uniref:uncharacterized protein n=1 Tax=Halteromyces radiatus TaxID=101107 RepID=UPI00221EE9B9|nr:uncharacterized protein BX664DRAFT_322446 [Halteromyces radiatus]KAI8099936.1 hypothetical protein BX664DRAFT_322446 [Halteromyces radiatus]
MNSNHLSINTNFENNITSNMTSNDRSRPSRLPRPKKLSIESIYQPLRRSSSNSSYTPTVSSSTSSTSDDYDIYQDEDALFSPVSTDLTTPMSRTISPLLFDKSTLIQLLRQEKINNEVERMETHDIFNDNLDDHIDDDNDDDDDDALLSPSDSLMASFERLDSSLAIVDSLSRDLASCRRRARSVSTLSDTMVMKNETLDNTNMDQSKNNETGYFDGWIIVLILPLLYIPCMLLNALWNELIVVATVESTTPLSYLSTKASMFVYESSFPSTELATPTAGLAVFLLSMSILHLLTMGSRNQEHGHRHVISSMDRSKYKMIRRSSLPMDPPFISLQPSINPHLRTSSSYT